MDYDLKSAELSKQFDEDIAPLVRESVGDCTPVTMNTSFNDWTDSLAKDGVIDQDTYNNCGYVGKYETWEKMREAIEREG